MSASPRKVIQRYPPVQLYLGDPSALRILVPQLGHGNTAGRDQRGDGRVERLKALRCARARVACVCRMRVSRVRACVRVCVRVCARVRRMRMLRLVRVCTCALVCGSIRGDRVREGVYAKVRVVMMAGALAAEGEPAMGLRERARRLNGSPEV